MEKCWLRDGCPGRTASCSSCQPTDDGCPVYRWFKRTLKEQTKQTSTQGNEPKEEMQKGGFVPYEAYQPPRTDHLCCTNITYSFYDRHQNSNMEIIASSITDYFKEHPELIKNITITFNQ